MMARQGTQRARREESGDNSGEDTPVSIPNTAVKLPCADDTWRAAAWESKTLPVSEKKTIQMGCLF